MLPTYIKGLKTKMDELQRVQNGCIKTLFQVPQLTPSFYLYTNSVSPLGKLAYIERVALVNKMFNSLTKRNFPIFTNSGIHLRTKRQYDLITEMECLL